MYNVGMIGFIVVWVKDVIGLIGLMGLIGFIVLMGFMWLVF